GCRKNLRFFLFDLHGIDRFAIRTISGADPFTELGFIGFNEMSLGELFASHAVPSNSARLGVSNFLDQSRIIDQAVFYKVLPVVPVCSTGNIDRAEGFRRFIRNSTARSLYM